MTRNCTGQPIATIEYSITRKTLPCTSNNKNELFSVTPTLCSPTWASVPALHDNRPRVSLPAVCRSVCPACCAWILFIQRAEHAQQAVIKTHNASIQHMYTHNEANFQRTTPGAVHWMVNVLGPGCGVTCRNENHRSLYMRGTEKRSGVELAKMELNEQAGTCIGAMDLSSSCTSGTSFGGFAAKGNGGQVGPGTCMQAHSCRHRSGRVCCSAQVEARVLWSLIDCACKHAMAADTCDLRGSLCWPNPRRSPTIIMTGHPPTSLFTVCTDPSPQISRITFQTPCGIAGPHDSVRDPPTGTVAGGYCPAGASEGSQQQICLNQ